MNKINNKYIRLFLIFILLLFGLYVIFTIINTSFDLSTGFNLVILCSIGIGIFHHLKNIDKPVNQELSDNFIWFLIFVSIVSVIIFFVYFFSK